jgi:hypothetical protein
MARYSEPEEDTKDLFNYYIELSGLHNFINIVIVNNPKSKDIFKIMKANEMLKYRAGDDVNIMINESILDQLTQEQREMVVQESLAGLHWDGEKDKLVISKPDVVTHSGVISKFGFDKYSQLHETIRLIYAQQEDSETTNA